MGGAIVDSRRIRKENLLSRRGEERKKNMKKMIS
jgi:hypothetical protein